MSVIDSIDLKLGVLIGFLGVFIVGVLVALLASDPAKIDAVFPGTGRVLFGLAGVLGLGSLVFAFLGFKMRQYYSGYTFSKLVEWSHENTREIQETFMEALLYSTRVNDDQLRQKQKFARVAVWCVFLTLVTLLAVAAVIGIKLLT